MKSAISIRLVEVYAGSRPAPAHECLEQISFLKGEQKNHSTDNKTVNICLVQTVAF